MANRPTPDREKIQRKERELYSRSYENEEAGTRRGFSKKDYDVNSDWEHTHEKVDAANGSSKTTSSTDSFFTKLFIFSLVFFIAAVGVAAYLFYSGSLTVSGEKVAVTVEAPGSVRAGEEVTLNTIVTNNNDVPLENVTLTAHYSRAARQPDDSSQVKKRDELSLDTIAPGQQVRSSFDAAFYGSKGATSTVTFVLQYGIEGSNATLDTRKEHVVALNSAPVSVSLDAPAEVNANQETTFDLTITSNTGSPINNLVLQAEYPQAFSFVEAEPSPGDDLRTWELGTLGADEERTISITGVMTAPQNEARTFRFTTGRHSGRTETSFDLVFDEQQKTVAIKEPYIGLETTMSGDPASSYVGEVGDAVEPTVLMTNNLPVRVTQAELSMTFSGNVYRPEFVNVSHTGFFRSVEDAAIWNNGTDEMLQTLISGQEYNASAAVGIPPREQLDGVVNPHLNIHVEAQADQREDAQLPRTVTASRRFQVKMNTKLAVEARTLYNTGPFETRGPIPPVADEETTYNVQLQAGNRFNDVTDAEVFATLPPYVEWVGKTTSNAMSYDRASRTITWDIGEMRKQTGSDRPAKQVTLQLRITPSIDQSDSQPRLLRNVGIRAHDSYTDREVSAEARSPTIDISHQEEYDGGGSIVTQEEDGDE